MEKIRSIRKLTNIRKKRMVPEYYIVQEDKNVMVVELTRNDLVRLQDSVNHGARSNFKCDVMEQLKLAWNGEDWSPEQPLASAGDYLLADEPEGLEDLT